MNWARGILAVSIGMAIFVLSFLGGAKIFVVIVQALPAHPDNDSAGWALVFMAPVMAIFCLIFSTIAAFFLFPNDADKA